jgi:fatty-acid desaturase
MTSNSVQVNSEPALKLEWTNVIFFGVFHALALLAPFCFSWKALGVMLLLHWLFGSIGICLGYHRLLTHRSLQVPKPLEYVLTIIGTLAMQGGPIFWVAGHRMHHLHTEDVDNDPYSAQRGFWWSHMLWVLYPRQKFFDYNSYRKFAPDLDKEPLYRWLDRTPNFLMLQIPVVLFLYWLGGWSFVIYGFVLRAVLLWHSTWFINSVTHVFGYKTYEIEDNSRNLWWAALLTYGEGWHNNHHAQPNVAKAGRKWWEIDMTWWAIRALQSLGLARRVIMPPN